MINSNIISEYIQKYLDRNFKEKVNVKTNANCYVLNYIEKCEIYKFWEKENSQLIEDFDKKTLCFKKDYIGTIFFFLSGYWEYKNNDIKKDKFGRFPAYESFQEKLGILETPVVDILVEEIKERFNLNYNSKKMRIFITHDIDHLCYFKFYKKRLLRNLLGDLLKRKSVKLFIEKLILFFNCKDPHLVENLIKKHKKNESVGNFFFMPDRQPKEVAAGYDLRKYKEYLNSLKKQIISSGSSIGIHYDARHIEQDRMKKDIEKLEKIFETKIVSGRAHFLLFDITKSFDIYEKSGVKLDTTCSYADKIGFRFSTCKPFRPFNFNENREYDFIEVPLIVMDVSLYNKRYMSLTPEAGYKKIIELMEVVKKYSGVFTLLWHNSSFYPPEFKGWDWVYEDVIKYAKANGFEFVRSERLICPQK